MKKKKNRKKKVTTTTTKAKSPSIKPSSPSPTTNKSPLLETREPIRAGPKGLFGDIYAAMGEDDEEEDTTRSRAQQASLKKQKRKDSDEDESNDEYADL